jgi:hypothetical protein
MRYLVFLVPKMVEIHNKAIYQMRAAKRPFLVIASVRRGGGMLDARPALPHLAGGR